MTKEHEHQMWWNMVSSAASMLPFRGRLLDGRRLQDAAKPLYRGCRDRDEVFLQMLMPIADALGMPLETSKETDERQDAAQRNFSLQGGEETHRFRQVIFNPTSSLPHVRICHPGQPLTRAKHKVVGHPGPTVHRHHAF